jgi:hypothetical protein
MSEEIDCPVCNRSAIDINICPNCQTDLSLIRMLTELPVLAPNSKMGDGNYSYRWGWQTVTLLISILVNLGLSLWLLI